MRRIHFLMFALLAVALTQVLLAQTSNNKPTKPHVRYEVRDLGTLGGSSAFGLGINNRGWVGGVSALAGDSPVHAFLWRDGVMHDLGTLGGPNSGSPGFLLQGGPNEEGQVAASSDTSVPEPFGNDPCFYGTYLTCHAFLWNRGVIKDLGTLGGNNSLASGINNRGQVSGFAENAVLDPTCQPPQVYQMKPVIWEKGRIKGLPTLPGDTDGWAFELNDRGHAVGGSGDCSTSVESWWGALGRHAVMWANGKVTNLGTLGGKYWNYAESINNRDQVVGYSDLPGDVWQHGFLWENGVMKDLGALPGDVASVAADINDKGQIVGYSRDENYNDTAILWEDGVLVDLNSLVVGDSTLYLFWAGSINARGEISGWGIDPLTGQPHAYLAVPQHCAMEYGAALSGQNPNQRPKKVSLPESIRVQLRSRYPLLYRGTRP